MNVFILLSSAAIASSVLKFLQSSNVIVKSVMGPVIVGETKEAVPTDKIPRGVDFVAYGPVCEEEIASRGPEVRRAARAWNLSLSTPNEMRQRIRDGQSWGVHGPATNPIPLQEAPPLRATDG